MKNRIIALILIIFGFIGCQTMTTGPEFESPKSVQWSDKPEWDKFLTVQVEKYWPDLSIARDANRFCPKWAELDSPLKKLAIKEMLIGIMFYESGWNPLNRYQESTMGKDPITGLPVHSEGLFQMSYQDEQWVKCGFDWNKDRQLGDTDPNKTILDPYINMACGVKVLAWQTKKYGIFTVGRGKQYWAVILDGGRYQKIDEIAARVKKNVVECN